MSGNTEGAIQRIVFLLSYPLSERDRRRFGFELLRARGFAVEAWDLSPWVWRHPPACGPETLAAARQFADRRTALAAVAGLDSHTLAVAIMHYGLGTRPVFAAMARSTAAYAMLNLQALPAPEAPRRRRWRGLPLRELAGRALEKALLPLLPVRPPRFMIGAGEASTLLPPGREPETEWIWTHALDYDPYLHLRASLPRADPQRAVFLDEYLPFHPDYALHAAAPPVTAERYFPALRRFFERMEAELGIRTTVAAHPSAVETYMTARYFGNLNVRRGATLELVAQSALVFCHSSTAVDFAVLLRKPVVFLVTPEMLGTPAWDLAHTMAALLRRPLLTLDRAFDLRQAVSLAVDDASYRRYQELYIKRAGTPDFPLWDIVAHRLRATSPTHSEPAPLGLAARRGGRAVGTVGQVGPRSPRNSEGGERRSEPAPGQQRANVAVSPAPASNGRTSQ